MKVYQDAFAVCMAYCQNLRFHENYLSYFT